MFQPLVQNVSKEFPALWPLLVGFIVMTTLTLLNMLIGVLVEVVGIVASTEKERLTVKSVSVQLETILETLDQDKNFLLSKAEFQDIVVHPQVAKLMREIGVDVAGLVDLADMIYEDLETRARGSAGDVDASEIG